MTLKDAFEMIGRGETPEQYKRRMARLRRLVNERDALEDKIDVLGENDARTKTARQRLEKVLAEIEKIK